MKRTAQAFVLLAGIGGCMSAQKPMADGQFNNVGFAKTAPGLVGPWGEPVPQTAPAAPTVRGQNPMPPAPGIQQAGYVPLPAQAPGGACGPNGCSDCDGCYGAAFGKSKFRRVGPPVNGYGVGSIAPVPPMGPWGAVAAVGAMTGGMPAAPLNARSSVKFVGPAEMKVTWYAVSPEGVPMAQTVVAPGRYNFPQGAIYRLKLSDLPNRPGVFLYPTLEVLPASIKTATFLAHSSIPIGFTDEDFDQVAAGNFVVKVIYLPDPQFQDLAVPGPDELVSTRLEPGVDPIIEAQRRGTILAIVRIGNIDLEAPNSPAMDAPNPYANPGMMPPPGLMPAPGGPAAPVPPPGEVIPGPRGGLTPPGARPTGPTVPASLPPAMRK